MLDSWRNWCRICAEDKCLDIVDIFLKFESCLDLPEIIRKFLHILIFPEDEKPTKICKRCFQILVSLNELYELCKKSDVMFTEIINSSLKLVNEDLIDFRKNYGIDTYSSERCKYLKEISNIFRSTNLDHKLNNNSNHHDLIKDENFPSDSIQFLDNQNRIEVKIEEHDENQDISVQSMEDIIENQDTVTEKGKEQLKVKSRKNRNVERIFKCELCDKVYSKRNSYNHHLSTKHNNCKLFCSQCPKSFSSKNSLRAHEKIHLPENMKSSHICTFCNKKFSVAFTLRQHIKHVHSNERAFICDECGKNFKTKQTLLGHQLSHREERPFQCPHCPKKFKSAFMLKIHSDHHTDTKYPCLKCDAIFNTRRSLTSHMVVHTDEKKHKCKFCGNEYKRYKALKYHLISHTGFRHACPFCDRTFADITNCRNHQKSIHPSDYAAAQLTVDIEKVQSNS